MSKLKCAQCGKTFGDNENVIGIGSGADQKPFCRKCAEELLGEPLPKAGQEKGGGKCFVATAACGDENAWEVLTLRHYRDSILNASVCGRASVRLYYLLAPLPARLVGACPRLRRFVLTHMIRPLAHWASERNER